MNALQLSSLAIVRHYMYDIHFVLLPDHTPLVYVCIYMNLNSKLTRWSLDMEGFKYDIQDRAGKCNGNALSRPPCCSCTVRDLLAVTHDNPKSGQLDQARKIRHRWRAIVAPVSSVQRGTPPYQSLEQGHFNLWLKIYKAQSLQGKDFCSPV